MEPEQDIMLPREAPHRRPPAQLYLAVWVALVILTGVTLGASYAEMGRLSIFTILLVATLKSGLVMLYFMHLRWERFSFWIMMMMVLITYGIFIFLTFSDYLYR